MLNALRLKIPNIRTASAWKIILSTLVFMVLVWIGIQAPRYVSYSFTDSVGYHWFYFKKGRPGHLDLGDFVIFPVTVDPALVPHCNPCNITKVVGCLPGQHLLARDRMFYCDGVFLGVAKTHSQKGVPLTSISYDGIIPHNRFFASGTCKDSYDSKYFGLVSQDSIEGIGIPLF